MSLPLGMVFLLWLHTSSLTKPAWFLEKKYFIAMTLLLFAFGFLVQEPLASQANLLSLEHDFKLNWFFAFVIPMAKTLTPGGALLVMSGFFILMISIPFWLKPRKESIKSTHNQKACTGCGQCVLDCPFTAIAMGPRTEGEGSEQVAFVDTDACVGCGICAASCSQMAIGPEDKSIRLQMNAIKELKQRFSKDETLIVYCRQSEAGKAFLKKNQNRAVLPIECSGNFHVASASFALKHFEKVKIFGCPTEACVNRLGQKLLEERFLHQRDPQPPPNTDLSRVEIISEPPATKASSAILTFVFVALLFGTYFLSAFPFASKFDKSVLRVALRIPSQTVEECVSQ
ncbi:MAG TPA: 4Fe-4S dicluster domain-containing protein, partial [Bdellovibrio sp.]|nr:4Fe-4S dicluster domain-containing protein [Bdellovibrio sp.]